MKKTNKNFPEERRKKIGLFLLEVVRATNDGIRPITQKMIIKQLRVRHRVKISPPTSTEYVSVLRSKKLGRKWLDESNGHELSLYSEDTVLSDSRAVKALFLAYKLRDQKDRVSLASWIEICEKQLNCDAAECQNFLADYQACGYAGSIEENIKTRNNAEDPEVIKGEHIGIKVRQFNEDGFYLKAIKNAEIKRRPPRSG